MLDRAHINTQMAYYETLSYHHHSIKLLLLIKVLCCCTHFAKSNTVNQVRMRILFTNVPIPFVQQQSAFLRLFSTWITYFVLSSSRNNRLADWIFYLWMSMHYCKVHSISTRHYAHFSRTVAFAIIIRRHFSFTLKLSTSFALNGWKKLIRKKKSKI